MEILSCSGSTTTVKALGSSRKKSTTKQAGRESWLKDSQDSRRKPVFQIAVYGVGAGISKFGQNLEILTKQYHLRTISLYKYKKSGNVSISLTGKLRD